MAYTTWLGIDDNKIQQLEKAELRNNDHKPKMWDDNDPFVKLSESPARKRSFKTLSVKLKILDTS